MKITFSSVLSIISFGVVLFSALILIQNQGYQSEKPVMFVTSGDKSLLLEKMTGAVVEGSNESTSNTILIDSSISYQMMDGFGYTLTGGSAWHLSEMDEPERKELLQELYGNAEHAIRINYLRISIGASDLDRETYSYNDLPEGETDEELSQFDIAPDREF